MSARILARSFMLLAVVCLSAPTAGLAATTSIWRGGPGYGFSGGFDVVPAMIAGKAWVLYGARASYGPDAFRVMVFLAGVGEDSQWDMILADPSPDDVRTFGSDLAGVGDVDGDGVDDIVVCAPLTMTSLEPDYPGGFYLYLGDRQISYTPDLEALIWAGEYRLIGRGVVGGGDFNFDGYDDFVIDAYRGDVSVGLVYFGGPALDDLPDLVIDNVRVVKPEPEPVVE